jgi:hypothetical protein
MISILLFTSCDKDTDITTDTSKINSDLIKRVGDTVTEMYAFFNEKNFDDYITYYRITDEEKNQILDNLKSNSQEFTTIYTVENVLAEQLEDNTIKATVILRSENMDADNNNLLSMRETMYYTFSEDNGKLYITAFEIGETQVL